MVTVFNNTFFLIRVILIVIRVNNPAVSIIILLNELYLNKKTNDTKNVMLMDILNL